MSRKVTSEIFDEFPELADYCRLVELADEMGGRGKNAFTHDRATAKYYYALRNVQDEIVFGPVHSAFYEWRKSAGKNDQEEPRDGHQ